ncbi:hypothetical protein [Kitasatospora sp. GP82]|uniref:hypothetical protein n=1 Tax=Kitasatospora sp. GP82 TaxID=3035089 RepID=UPI0024771619|nr:hypothetical protein [Kitasatospora sp. GP82]MDH6128866.1 hypothetical protein [Kitasatospora sp. GP82]
MPSTDSAAALDPADVDIDADVENFRTLLSRLVSSLEADRRELALNPLAAPGR